MIGERLGQAKLDTSRGKLLHALKLPSNCSKKVGKGGEREKDGKRKSNLYPKAMPETSTTTNLCPAQLQYCYCCCCCCC